MDLRSKIEEFIYSFSTNDKYSEFDSRKSFNRINKPDNETLLEHHDVNEIFMSEEFYNPLDGVHEVKLAWRHIKNWLVTYAPDLNASLQEKCTKSDLDDFQKDLNIKLPNCVIEFFQMTDGQSNFGTQSDSLNGLCFGLLLMSLDEILIATGNWRKIADIFNSDSAQKKQHSKLNELAKLPSTYNSIQIKKKLTDNGSTHSNGSTTSLSTAASSVTSSLQLQIPKQRSIPPGTIHETFAHPMWIPLFTDEVGNYIGIDLSPPTVTSPDLFQSTGHYGQVILFGREFDTKLKVADNFGDFLLIFANDLESGNWEITRDKKNNDGDLFIGNEGSMIFIDKDSELEVPYLEILKKRAINDWLTSVKKLGETHEIPAYIRQLAKEITAKDNFILHYKNNNPTDRSIFSNLADIDSLNQPMHSRSSRTSTSSGKRVPTIPEEHAKGTHEDSSNEAEETLIQRETTIPEITSKLDDINF